jgi:hypothetical protein
MSSVLKDNIMGGTGTVKNANTVPHLIANAINIMVATNVLMGLA